MGQWDSETVSPSDRPTAQAAKPAHGVTLREAFWVWVKVAIYSFGEPAVQIAVMHKLLVEEKRWVSEHRFLHALNYAMLLPGPEAQQLATYLGWLLHQTRGGLIAGSLFILPGFVSILALSILYAEFHQITFVQALFYGLKPAVLAIVVEALVRISKRALKTMSCCSSRRWPLSASSFSKFPSRSLFCWRADRLRRGQSCVGTV